MAPRTTPYAAFNFIVTVGQGETLGGFSDVSGLQTEITVSEYREGKDPLNHVRKIQGIHKVGDLTLKRGIVSSALMWQWIQDTRTKGPDAKQEVSVTLRDEAGKNVQTWNLHRVIPLKYTGPTLAAKGGGDVAMEELVLSSEGLDLAV